MYINLGKILKIASLVAGVIILAFGVIRFIFGTNLQLQSASALVAIFGLQLIWFILWLGRK